MTEEEKKAAQLHKGHRQRVRQRFLSEGLDVFTPHETLELLLFYARPRVNTNEMAHRLLNRFGTLASVFDADVTALQEVEGVDEATAVLLKLIAPLTKRYRLSAQKNVVLGTFDATCDYFKNVYIGEQVERLRLACLDDKLRLLRCGVVGEGAPGTVPVNTRKILEFALRQNCELVVIAHNHPNGSAVPSNEDIVATKHIYNALKTVGIRLLDHVIVAGEQAISLKEFGAFSLLD